MKHFLLMLAIIVGASSILAPSTVEAGCADKCSKALSKALDRCPKKRTPRAMQHCLTAAQQRFHSCQRACARGNTKRPKKLSQKQENANRAKSMAKIKARCSAKWGDNYRMQKYCRKRQTEGFSWVGRFVVKHKLGVKPYPVKTVQFKVTSKCWTKWTDNHGQNWPMVKYCIKRQMAAYRSL